MNGSGEDELIFHLASDGKACGVDQHSRGRVALATRKWQLSVVTEMDICRLVGIGFDTLRSGAQLERDNEWKIFSSVPFK